MDIYPRWQVRSEVTVDEFGDIVDASLLMIDRDTPETQLQTRFTFEWTQDPLTIELPPAQQTVSLTSHLEETRSDA
jgi:hypothetical protein